MDSESFKYHGAEIGQAWSHYRHIEETRTKYLSFFATVVLAATGFLTTVLKDASALSLVQVAMIAVFLLLLFAFSITLWANLIRVGIVLDSYDVILERTREAVHGSASPLVKLWLVRQRFPPDVRDGTVFDPQAAACSLVYGVLVVLLIGEVFLALLAWHSESAEGRPLAFVLFAIASGMFFILIVGRSKAKRIQSHVESNGLRSGTELPAFAAAQEAVDV